MLKVLVLCVALLAINSCATQNEKSDYRLGDSVGKGLVVFSLSLEGSRSVYLAFRRVGQDEQNVVYLNTYGIKNVATNYDWEEPFGRLIYLELEAGEYEFYGWHPQYCGWSEKCYALAGRVHFSAIPDSVTYLGNIHFVILSEDRAYKFEISDEFDRDDPRT